MRTVLAVALIVVVSRPVASGQNLSNPLLSCQRALFLGDSITAAGQYVAYVETWLALTQASPPHVINAGLPSETVSGLSEPGHAGGRFPRPDLAERLARALDVAKPDLVLACYGMNCGVYLPWDENRFAAYQEGILRLQAAVERAGARLVLIAPACYDDDVRPLDFSYDDVLARYSAWLIERRDGGGQTIDFHGPMSAERKRRRAADAKFTFQPDGVHPNDAGHWFMAQQVLAWLGEARAADWNAPAEMMVALNAPAEIPRLVQERMRVLRDAYVAAIGHRRPEVPAGLPLEQAQRRAAELTDEIRTLRARSP